MSVKNNYSLDLEQFLKLSKTANVIPVYKEISADLDTPVSTFLKLEKDDYAFLLESVEGQEKIARYSFLASGSSLVFKSKGNNIEIVSRKNNKKTVKKFVTDKDPLFEIKKIMQSFKPVNLKELPRFYGGFVGYIGYDTVRFFEEIPDKNSDDLGVSDVFMILTDNILVFDHVKHTVKIVVNIILSENYLELSVKEKICFYNKAIKEIEKINQQFNKVVSYERLVNTQKNINFTSNFEKSEFCGIVNKAKKHINKGDIIQVVLSQRFRAKISKSPFDIYRKLRSLNPSPYMFFLKLENIVLIGASPELLVRFEDGIVRTRPIAGTRKRGSNEVEDLALEKELLIDEKERAEHIMLVDLGRNDLGRVGKLGTVEVSNFMQVEKYSHVMHIVSEVQAQLDKGFDCFDVLRACFPAGTVSGSPKVRAMQIIDQLENIKRNTYAGAVGYFGFSGNMDTCITIRTILVKDNIAYIQAGAGIVADSVPEKEYNESINKAKVLMMAIE